MCVCVCVCVFACICVCICGGVHAWMCGRVCTCMWVHVYIHVSVWVHCVCVCMHVVTNAIIRAAGWGRTGVVGTSSLFHPGDLLCLCCPPCDCEAVVECGRLASPSWSSSRDRERSMFWLLCSWPCTVALLLLLLLQEEKQKKHLHLSTGPEWMSASKSTCIA